MNTIPYPTLYDRPEGYTLEDDMSKTKKILESYGLVPTMNIGSANSSDLKIIYASPAKGGVMLQHRLDRAPRMNLPDDIDSSNDISKHLPTDNIMFSIGMDAALFKKISLDLIGK